MIEILKSLTQWLIVFFARIPKVGHFSILPNSHNSMISVRSKKIHHGEQIWSTLFDIKACFEHSNHEIPIEPGVNYSEVPLERLPGENYAHNIIHLFFNSDFLYEIEGQLPPVQIFQHHGNLIGILGQPKVLRSIDRWDFHFRKPKSLSTCPKL